MAAAAKKKKVRRILLTKIKLPAPEAIGSLSMMMHSAKPFVAAMGNPEMRLLRNVDDPTELVQIVEYDAEHAVELNRQKLASDPMTRNFVQAWRTLFPGGVTMDVYEDVSDGV